MTDEIKKYLLDILNSIKAINEYLAGKKSFKAYKQNRVVKRAVERELEIIGEAMNNVLKIETKIEIVDARQIVNLRNQIIHAYDSVDDNMIWSIVINHLPNLKKEVEKLLE